MMHLHRAVLWEAWREMKAYREDYRTVLDVERRRWSRMRLERVRSTSAHTVHRGEHRAVLESAKRMAREGLEAHRKALQENAWLLKLVELYERVQQMRAQRAQAQAEAAQAVRPVAVQPVVAQT